MILIGVHRRLKPSSKPSDQVDMTILPLSVSHIHTHTYTYTYVHAWSHNPQAHNQITNKQTNIYNEVVIYDDTDGTARLLEWWVPLSTNLYSIPLSLSLSLSLCVCVCMCIGSTPVSHIFNLLVGKREVVNTTNISSVSTPRTPTTLDNPDHPDHPSANHTTTDLNSSSSPSLSHPTKPSASNSNNNDSKKSKGRGSNKQSGGVKEKKGASQSLVKARQLKEGDNPNNPNNPDNPPDNPLFVTNLRVN